MPLSDREQRLLDEIEQSLIAEDPKFASSVRLGRATTTTRIRQMSAIAAVIIGLGCIAFGLITGTSFGASIATAGFVLIVAGCWVAIGARARQQPADGRRSRE